MDDRQIVAGLLEGSAAAADALIDRFGGPLVRYFSVHLPEPSQAEDMTQETFVRLIGSLRRSGASSPPEIRSLYSLLFTIARHLAIDVGKAAKRQPPHLSLDQTLEFGADDHAPGPQIVRFRGDSPDPRESASTQQERALLETALRAVAPEHREVLVLRHIEGLSGREIGEILNLPEGSVWSRLNRGLAELRREFTRLTNSPARPNPAPREGASS